MGIEALCLPVLVRETSGARVGDYPRVITGAAEADVMVAIAGSVVQVKRKQTCVRVVVPIRTAEKQVAVCILDLN